jgi:hypothetical protein
MIKGITDYNNNKLKWGHKYWQRTETNDTNVKKKN